MSTESILRMELKVDSMLFTLTNFPPKYHWCVEQFGPEGSRWRVVPVITQHPRFRVVKEFEFADERDLMMFILRWL